MPMHKIIIGVQGDIGSTNERAARFFANQYQWTDIEIRYLISTENVLKALEAGEIDYGTFAWSSSRGGLVEETQAAIAHYQYTKVDEHAFQLDHALLTNQSINPNQLVRVYSHFQALKEHRPYLEQAFTQLELVKEIDTAIAAKKMSQGMYPENSLIIAPVSCAALYQLKIYQSDLPTNNGYLTTIYLVKK